MPEPVHGENVSMDVDFFFFIPTFEVYKEVDSFFFFYVSRVVFLRS